MTSPRESGTGLPGDGRLALLVCSANVCRSPMTQFLLEHETRAVMPENPWVFLSAGTDAEEGRPLCRASSRAIARVPGGSVFAETHRSRPLTRDLVEQASLVLTASVHERSIVARLVPERRNRLFTMIEAARLAEVAEVVDGDPASSADEIYERLHRARGHTAPRSPRPAALLGRSPGIDLPDVHTGGARTHRPVHSGIRWLSGELRELFLRHSEV